MLYFDTSFLAPLILPEATSDQIAAFVRRLPAEEFAVSHWTRVEFSSLIGREVRMGSLDAQAAARALPRIQQMVIRVLDLYDHPRRIRFVLGNPWKVK